MKKKVEATNRSPGIITLFVILAVVLIGVMFVLLGNGSKTQATVEQNNVSMVDEKQIIEINAKGGYLPRNSIAKANTPTAIKIITQGTFDCSSAVVIPSLGYRRNLPPSGETFIQIPPQKEGSTLQVLCAMGMYNFSVKFN